MFNDPVGNARPAVRRKHCALRAPPARQDPAILEQAQSEVPNRVTLGRAVRPTVRHQHSLCRCPIQPIRTPNTYPSCLTCSSTHASSHEVSDRLEDVEDGIDEVEDGANEADA